MIAMTTFCGMGVLGSIMLTRTSRATSERVRAVTQGHRHITQGTQSSKELQKKVFAAVLWVRLHLGMSEDPRLRARFARAGFKSASSRDMYMAARMLVPIGALGVGSLIPSHKFLCMIALAGISYLAPNIVLERLIKRRREKIR